MKPKKVFLSYSAVDRAFADRLGKLMRNLGVEVEDASSILSSGSEWAESIRSSLEETDAVLLVVPEAGTKGANNAFFEAGAAHALGKLVLAVVPEQRTARLRELPTDLVGFAAIDASSKSLHSVARTLVNAMEPA